MYEGVNDWMMLLKTRIKTNQWLTSFVEVLTEVWTSHPSKVRGQEPCLTQYLRSFCWAFSAVSGLFCLSWSLSISQRTETLASFNRNSVLYNFQSAKFRQWKEKTTRKRQGWKTTAHAPDQHFKIVRSAVFGAMQGWFLGRFWRRITREDGTRDAI